MLNFSVVKVINDVDFGVMGKKNVSIEANIVQEKDGSHKVVTTFSYVVDKGMKTPIDKTVLSQDYVKTVIEQALQEIKAINTLNFGRN